MVSAASVALAALMGVACAVPQELVERLGDEDFNKREKAEDELIVWAKKSGQKAVDELGKLMEKEPSPEVKSRLDNVIAKASMYRAIPGTHGFMGISMEPVLGGAVILAVSPRSPAQKAGLLPNDVIVKLDGIELSEKNNHIDEATDFLREYVLGKKAGEKLSVKIERNGHEITKDLKLGNYEKEVGQAPELRRMGGGAQGQAMLGGQLKILPRPRNVDPKQAKENEIMLLELNMESQEQLLEMEGVPKELKDALKLQNEETQKKIDKLKAELKLEKQVKPKK